MHLSIALVNQFDFHVMHLGWYSSALHHSTSSRKLSTTSCRFILEHYVPKFISSETTCRIFQKWNTVFVQHLAGCFTCLLYCTLPWTWDRFWFLQRVTTAYINICMKLQDIWAMFWIVVASRTSRLQLSGSCRRVLAREKSSSKTTNKSVTYSNLHQNTCIVYRRKGIYEAYGNEH